MAARLVLVVLIAATALAGCNGRSVPAPAEVETCVELVEVGVALVEDYLDALADAPLAALTGEAPPTPVLAELATRGDELDRRAAGLGCDPVALNRAISTEVADLEPDGEVAKLFVTIVQEGIVGTLPTPPTTLPVTTAG